MSVCIMRRAQDGMPAVDSIQVVRV